MVHSHTVHLALYSPRCTAESVHHVWHRCVFGDTPDAAVVEATTNVYSRAYCISPALPDGAPTSHVAVRLTLNGYADERTLTPAHGESNRFRYTPPSAVRSSLLSVSPLGGPADGGSTLVLTAPPDGFVLVPHTVHCHAVRLPLYS